MAPAEMAGTTWSDGDAVAVLFGSETGTAEEVAWDLAREGRRRGIPCAVPRSLSELDVPRLAALRFAVFVVSTTGQGDPPVSMRPLWRQLLSASLPGSFLAGLSFAVFGLGDSHYREFNYAARRLHARLRGLGATEFFRIGLGDDQHDFGLEQELDPWAEGVWAALARLLPSPVAGKPGRALPELDCRYIVEDVEGSFQPLEPLDGAASEGAGAGNRPRALLGPKNQEAFVARVVGNESLVSSHHANTQQDVRNIRLALPQGQSYEAGDVCVVWPCADPALIERFVVETLGRSLSSRIRIRTLDPAAESSFPEVPLTLQELFSRYVDITAVPSRHFFEVLSRYTDHELHRKKLAEFASRTLEAKDALYEYCKRERRSAADVMWDFWTARPPLAELLSCLPPMRPRRYSIASSPSWYRQAHAAVDGEGRWGHDGTEGPGIAGIWSACREWRRGSLLVPALRGPAVVQACTEALALCASEGCGTGQVTGQARLHGGDHGCQLDLCVAVVAYTTRSGRECKGLCSSYLQRARPGASMLCNLERGTLALPPLDVPMILVCPGTGLSPCRALVQERHLAAASSTTTCGRLLAGLKDLLFLGFRHRDGDFLYAEEWAAFSAWLSVHVAFSRNDPDRKVYVQDCIEQDGEAVCRLLDAGARVYVCGRSHPMPSQVFDAFVEALHAHRGLTPESAAARLREMQRTRSYVCDTWG